MSGFGGPGGRQISYKPTPPEKGSFPLDHDAECKHFISSYLRCLKAQSPPGKNNEECRGLAKSYLGCRMEKGLMAQDEWKNLGFPEPDGPREKGEDERVAAGSGTGTVKDAV